MTVCGCLGSVCFGLKFGLNTADSDSDSTSSEEEAPEAQIMFQKMAFEIQRTFTDGTRQVSSPGGIELQTLNDTGSHTAFEF